MTGLLNLSLVIVPFIVAHTISIDSSFETTSRLFVVISLLATITAALLYYKGILGNTDTDRDEYQYNHDYDSCSEYGDDCYNDYWSEEFSDAWESPNDDEGQDDDDDDGGDVNINRSHEEIQTMDVGERNKDAHHINDYNKHVHPPPSVESTLHNHLSSSPAYQQRNNTRRSRYETA